MKKYNFTEFKTPNKPIPLDLAPCKPGHEHKVLGVRGLEYLKKRNRKGARINFRLFTLYGNLPGLYKL